MTLVSAEAHADGPPEWDGPAPVRVPTRAPEVILAAIVAAARRARALEESIGGSCGRAGRPRDLRDGKTGPSASDMAALRQARRDLARVIDEAALAVEEANRG